MKRSRRNGRSSASSLTRAPPPPTWPPAPEPEPPHDTAEPQQRGGRNRGDDPGLAHGGREPLPIAADIKAQIGDEAIPNSRSNANRDERAQDRKTQRAGERRDDGPHRGNKPTQEQGADPVLPVQRCDPGLGQRPTVAKHPLLETVRPKPSTEAIHDHGTTHVAQPGREERAERRAM